MRLLVVSAVSLAAYAIVAAAAGAAEVAAAAAAAPAGVAAAGAVYCMAGSSSVLAVRERGGPNRSHGET